MSPKWTKQPEFDLPVWYLEYEDGYFVVGKSYAGDWYAGWNPIDSPCITDDTYMYFDNWREARKYCERLNLECDII